ncbi:MAG: glycosyltransferase family 4 protein [Ignavibacteriae bacterium]|nr:glycosyltransferase family 4 protein [Ignavibacteriota bacterium]
MKIAYVSTFDAHLVQSWSGLGYYIAKAIEQSGIEVEYVGPLKEKNSLYYKAKQFFYRELFKKRHIRQAEPAILRENARQISKQIKELNPDIVFAVWTYPIAYLECEQPIVFTADATFPLMHDYYDDYSNLSDTTIKNTRKMEQLALNRSSAIIYCSEWAANSAVKDYGINPDKVHVVPYGANIDYAPNEQQIETFIQNRSKSEICKLLFLGVDWERKGGTIAYNTMLELNKRGIATVLTVCGCIPPKEFTHSQVSVIPFLDKTKTTDREHLNKLLQDSHFLLLPTRKEAYGLVFCEACAYGLPSITTDTGGVSEIIHDGINGYTLPLELGAKEYADKISDLWTNQDQYKALAHSAHNEYQKRLNWNSAGKSIKSILENLLLK